MPKPSTQTILVLFIPGLLFSLAYAWIKAETGSPFLINSLGLLQTLVHLSGAVLLALAYLAIIFRLFQAGVGKTILSQLAKLGRLSLSNYLIQTTLCVLLFYGYGYALMGTIPFVYISLFAISILCFQVLFSHFWLQRYSQGPMEWLWKRCTYR